MCAEPIRPSSSPGGSLLKNNEQCNDGRETALLEFIKAHPQYSEMKGSPEAVLAAIDEFGRTKDFLMNIGREKGRAVTDIIAKQKPTTWLEIGCYVGFSAILFGNEMRKVGGDGVKYRSLELNPTFAGVARELIALAGLDETVEIIEGPCRESLRKIQQEGGAALDVIFIDHAKVLYLNELKLCEELGFVASGTTVIADDIVQSNNVEYSAYVRESPAQKKKHYEEKKANKDEGDVSLGNPNLIYETSLFRGREPTGGEVRAFAPFLQECMC